MKVKEKCDKNIMFQASEWGYMGIVKLLLMNGINIDEKDNYGETPLMKAVYRGRSELVELLLRAGADVNAYYNRYNTALDYAEQKNDEHVIYILRTAGAKRGYEA